MTKPYSCHSLCCNPLLGDEDELAGGLPRALTEDSNTPTSSPVISQALTLAPPSTNELFKQFIKAYLESNQGPS